MKAHRILFKLAFDFWHCFANISHTKKSDFTKYKKQTLHTFPSNNRIIPRTPKTVDNNTEIEREARQKIDSIVFIFNFNSFISLLNS